MAKEAAWQHAWKNKSKLRWEYNIYYTFVDFINVKTSRS